jgi:Sulfatase
MTAPQVRNGRRSFRDGTVVRGTLAAWLVGAMLGELPLIVEWMARDIRLSARALGGFAAVGGLAAAGAYLVTWRAARAPQRAAITVAALLAALELVFFVDVVLLPRTRSFEWPDLPVAIALLAGGLGLAMALQRAWWTGVLPRAAPLATAAGAATLVLCAVAVISAWPPASRPAPARSSDGPNLIVICIDAARRDHVGLYGYARPTSLAVDAVAGQARIFDGALAASSWTRHSVPAILGVKRARGPSQRLVSRLQAQGYTTAAFSDNPVLEQGSSVVAGFDVVAMSVPRALQFPQRVFEGTFVGTFVFRWPTLAYLWNDDRLVDKAVRWGASVRGPFFMYVHLMDAHMPYKRAPIDGRAWRGRRLDTVLTGQKVSAVEREDVISHYDGGLRCAFDQARRLIDAARQWNRPALIIVTSDHGESLGEENRWGHGLTLAPELLAVPLLVVGPGVTPGRVAAPVGHQSIASTLLAAAGVPCGDCVGSDLRRSDGDAVVEGELPPNLKYRVEQGFKIVFDKRSGTHRLYRIDDVSDTVEVGSRYPDVARSLLQRMTSPTPLNLAPEDLDRMRGLGYISD